MVSRLVVAYHLICEGTPSGRGVDKWICRSESFRSPQGRLGWISRAILRRLPTAIGQAAYCAWLMAPFVLAYDFASLAFVRLNPSGVRLPESTTRLLAD